jgi:hypothetical protein
MATISHITSNGEEISGHEQDIFANDFFHSKKQLLVKKIQDKKSQEIYEDELSLDDVTDILEISESQGGYDQSSYIVSILATMKSIAHTVQSKARWAKFASDHGASEEIFTFSSKGDFSKVHQITDALVRPNPLKHLVFCSVLVRFQQIIDIVKHFELINECLKKPREFRLYLDELDKYIDTVRHIIDELARSKIVKRIVIVTATPSKIWAPLPGWEKLHILNPRVVEGGENYLMFKECRYFPTDAIPIIPPSTDDWLTIGKKQNKKLIEHHHKILLTYPDLLNVEYRPERQFGRTIFAPGLQTRESHSNLALFWNHFGCNVIIVNGERTADGYYGRLLLNDGSQIDIPHMSYNEFETMEMRNYLASTSGICEHSQAQLNDIISEFYFKYKLYNRPLVITGRLCVERAQSLVHPVWGTFTDAIYYDAVSPDDAYQQQRQLGHVKHWPTYRGLPRIFAPQKYHDDVTILEERSHKFASLFAQSHATHKDYLTSAGENKLTTHETAEKKRDVRAHTASLIRSPDHPFEGPDAFDKVKKYLQSVFPNTIVRPHAMHKVDGYEISTRLTNYYKKEKDKLTAEDRLTEEKFKRFNSSAFGISSTGKGQLYMIYPVYPTMMSTPSEVRYYVRYLPPNSAHDK